MSALTGPEDGAGSSGITLGTEFAVSAACQATAVYWWQPSGGNSDAARTVAIYPVAGGSPLATATVAPSGSGWQRVEFSAPVSLAIGKYRAATFHPYGRYPATAAWWTPTSSGGTLGGKDGLSNGILSAPNSGNAVSNAQGVYTEGEALAFPSSTFNSASYWVDVEISTGSDPLGTPVVTVTNQTASTVTVTWPAVPTATRYEAGTAPGYNQTALSVVQSNATSPYTFTGLSEGDYTVGIRAVRE